MHKHKLFAGFCGVLCGVIAAAVAVTAIQLPFAASFAHARSLEQKRGSSNWKVLTETEVASGATIPSSTHTFFTVPEAIDRIGREILLGNSGRKVRYWGYCFPDESDSANPRQSVGFPGKMFLSEAERAWRAARENSQNALSPFRLSIPLNQTHAAANPVRHQLEYFTGMMTCYIMTEKELPIGADYDDDGLNNKLERQYQTDPGNPDTDDDGLNDGKETIGGTDPLGRDTDSDGLVDGIEDANRNGRWDIGETNPLKPDTDGDGLPDGLARHGQTRKTCKDNKGLQCVDIPYDMQIGEDKNLNGRVDAGESDPRKIDTIGNGIRDDVRFYKCLLDSRKDC
ncbi:hypothetical protein HYW84_01780 [Candidatus Peregrinibacteria bacterium]|nr:hypothetical protein [Candidatus Peregrinibacteria bacterium]